MNKKCIYMFCLFSLVTLMFACDKDDKYNLFESPHWALVEGDYSESMSGVISLPQSIESYLEENDELAVFMGDECRGIGSIVDKKFYINVVGTSTENTPITIKYFSSRNKYMYVEESALNFKPDLVIGTSDNPFVLNNLKVQ